MRLNDKSGVALVFTTAVMLVLVIMTAAYIYLATVEKRNVNNQEQSLQAFYLSEAGLHKAVWYLQSTAPDGTTDGSWRTDAYPAAAGDDPTDPRLESLGQGNFIMWVEDYGGHILITSSGGVGEHRQTLQQEVTLMSGTPNTVTAVTETWREI